MLVKENIEIGGKAFVKTYSDAGFYVERDSAKYTEAIDPAGIQRTYTETGESIPPTEAPNKTKLKAEAYDYLTGRSAADE